MAYSTFNSLSPMMFRKVNGAGTYHERDRSRSLEDILDIEGDASNLDRGPRKGSLRPSMNMERPEWSEISLVKSMAPVVTCVLPTLSMDMVCSALLAVGATPLITEDPMDMEKDLQNSKAVLVDIGAPRAVIEAFMEHYVVGQCPLVLVTAQAGCNDRKKQLATQIIDQCGPSTITGSLGDIFAISQEILEKGSQDDSDSGSCDEGTLPTANTPNTPTVVLDSETSVGKLHAVFRRAKMKNRAIPIPKANSGDNPTSGPRRSVSPRGSPRGSPRASPRASPHISPVQRKMGGPLRRVPTALPRVRMKGQFRDGCPPDIKVDEVLAQGQLLAAHTDAFVHLYEMSVVTGGEVIVEVTNSQMGMGALHSVIPTSGAIMAAVLACVEAKGDDITVKHCSHALALFYVAAEEAASKATKGNEKGLVSPGTLRMNLIDALHYLDEPHVRLKAQIFAHSTGTKSS